jgi:hypothetical protein
MVRAIARMREMPQYSRMRFGTIQRNMERTITLRFGLSEDVIQKPDHFPYRRLGQWDVPLSALTKEDYYNDLKQRLMSDEELIEKRQWHAKLGLRTVGDEHDAYLASDVLTLADAWASWRRNMYEILGLDPAWSLTLPTLAYKSLSRFAEGKVELFTEADAKINDRLNESIIGGICIPFQREYYRCRKRAHETVRCSLALSLYDGWVPSYRALG